MYTSICSQTISRKYSSFDAVALVFDGLKETIGAIYVKRHFNDGDA